MVGIGCLMPFILAVIGAVIGHFLAGMVGAAWGLGTGFLVGGGIAAFVWHVFMRAKEED